MVVAGVGLLLAAARQPDKPDTLRGRLLNGRLQEVLERPRRVERFIYRHHRLFGVAIVAGALMLLAVLGAGKPLLFWVVLPGGPSVRAAMVVLWVLAVAVLVIGIIVLVRPSALKGVETLANRWIQLFPATVLTPRQIGALLLVGGIACLLVATRMND
ncbi:MAG: hypothetical protein FIA96_06355 [Betaproteobacteria bacterium]|nr:hypothetical protein [Betaproteobacteria bacterium]